MGNKVPKASIMIGGAAITAVALILNQRRQRKNSNKGQNQLEQTQTEQFNEEQVPQEQTSQNVQQVINSTENQNPEDSNSIDSISFINRVNKELKAFQEQQVPLSFDVLMKITEAGFKLVARNYSQMQNKNRNERRQLLNIPQQYTLKVLEFNNELEILINQNQLDICKKLRISSEIYENSFVLQFQTQAALERFIVFQFSMRQQLIASIPSQKEINESQLAQVADIQLKKLDDIQFFKNYLQQLQGEDQQFSSIIITVLLSDIVYQQLGFEEEDILKAVLAYPVLKNQLSLIQQKVQAVMEMCFQ
ncbi:unnamed protein product (macronuclear) [Paramecium tetraurelia]|uniref:Uncharacterized protein n=1 Tax=Paramecium tetraurelia TaxID=5888 RepID=A0CRL2_PARTE|nr:uncharacterized protein GSPATT00009744001 [Paramecium tetraurelia]CAK73429.1 unnamed protein product [Paramecium tetraurelia]|eukprot:XP_001440826.1 hypothetical protein (macronuclear) [Paramecium tetraurelia strain d4-2]